MSAFELGEHLHQRLAEDVRQHVEAAAMGHADDTLRQPELTGLLDGVVHACDSRLCPIDAESLRRLVLVVKERLEHVDGCEVLVDVEHFLVARFHEIGRLDAAPDPVELAKIANVHVLYAERAAVNALQSLDHVADGGAGLQDLGHQVGVHRASHVRILDAMICGIQLRNLGASVEFRSVEGSPLMDSQRVERRGLVPPRLVGPDQVLEACHR
mmetsp:Transcript_60761/g.169866  ORF Transcript_60761/g.169866 Transcript_60761/m.169866 type:complete len:213 (+) Transcript_60761:2263-2901(+)